MPTRKLVRQFMAEHGLQYFVTFNFGYLVDPITGGGKVRHFLNVIQDRTYGGRWAKRRGPERITCIGVWERLKLNPHLHCGVYAPDPVARVLLAEGPKLWRDQVRRGQLDVSRSKRRDRVRNYTTKGLWLPDHQDRLYLYAPPGGSGVRFDDPDREGVIRGRTPRPRAPLRLR